MERAGFSVEIVEIGARQRPTRIRVRFEAPLADVQLGQFRRDPPPQDAITEPPADGLGPWRLHRVQL